MKQFARIFKFELKNYTKNKTFVGTTVFLVVAIAAVMFFPRIMELIHGADRSEAADGEQARMLVYADDASLESTVISAFSSAFSDYELSAAESAEVLKESVSEGAAECGFVFESATSYTYFVDNLSMYDVNTDVADGILTDIYRMNEMVSNGIAPEAAGAILSAAVVHQTESLGKDQGHNFFYTYIMIFALYIVILLYGQMIATSVATEKSSRAMELLITSAKPVSMMFGKVLASCLAGFMQLFCVFGSALLCFNLNKSYWDESGMVTSLFNMPVGLFVYMLVFFILGFLIYAFLYGAIGSTASKLEDINTSVMPITLLFVVGFIVVMSALASGNVDTVLMRVCSYVPFTSPMAMFTRIAMSTVPVWEIFLSIAVLIASVVGTGVLSAKIYRVGVLLYGTAPKLGAIIRALRRV